MKLKYYPIQQNWRKLRPYYQSQEARDIWYPDMVNFLHSRREQYNIPGPFTDPENTDLRPSYFDHSDWRYATERRGRKPAFWEYVCHAACHWVVDLHLWVASHVEPERPWRIVTSQKHSTVWDGEQTLFDGNFLALGIPSKETWELAAMQPDSKIVKPMWRARYKMPKSSAAFSIIKHMGRRKAIRPEEWESFFSSHHFPPST